jgi:predicted TIM-barrel fold metal-dependent hydrolase
MSDAFVIDGVCHPYNFSPENEQGRFGRIFNDVLYSYHPAFNPPGVALSREDWGRRWEAREFLETMLLESDTDMICVHSLPIFDAYKDGGASPEIAAAAKHAHPDRVLWYAGMDMFDPASTLDAAKRFIDNGADGLKFYPAKYVDGRTQSWRMDDEPLVFPLLEYARAAGVRNVAIHKALPIGPITSYSMNVDDISLAANAFPEINFQVVHAGFMFVDETKFLIANHANIYATMEASFLFCKLNPRKFAELLTEFMIYAGPQKIIYSSAAVNPHPQIVLDAFANFTMPDDSPIPLNNDIRAMILGGNLARLHGIDIEDRRQRLASDEFSAFKREFGRKPPFSSVARSQAA